MNILIPMAGLGERFQKEGYLAPKPLIKVRGKPILQYLFDCLYPKDNETVFIPYLKPLDIKGVLIKKFADIRVYDDLGNITATIKGSGKGVCKCIEMSIPSCGATETLSIAASIMDPDVPLVSFDCDNFYPGDILERLRELEKNWGICYFEDFQSNPIYSYIKVSNNKVVEIAEKKKISDMACSGVYYFGNTGTVRSIARSVLNISRNNGTEVYISEIYKHILGTIPVFPVLEPPVSLGTPMAVENYSKSIKNGNSLIYCFDLDGTLVSIANDYSKVEPISEVIEFIRFLKTNGNTIIIYTARGMLSRNSNLSKIEEEIVPQIKATLKDFAIPYDQLIIGKPYADFYIDDKAISTYSSLQKETGMYNKIVSPNASHTLHIENNYIVKKGSLDGEKWWYQHIPIGFEYLFPSLNLEKSTSSELWIEKVNGLTFSEKYIAGSLTSNHLQSLLKTLKELHQSLPSHNGLDLNHTDKLKKRYIDYPPIYDHTNLFERLMNHLRSYNEYEYGVIHGDPVFTNIILTSTNTLKFIDMRGKIGDTLTIYGDCNYDYAKIYQSLSGYDFILHQHQPSSSSCQSEMISVFEKEMGVKRMKWIYLLTASLYFSLIPLHLNETPTQILNYYKMTDRLLSKYESI